MNQYATLMKQIKAGQIAPLYFIQGTENYLMDQCIQEIIRQSLAPEELEMNLIDLDLDTQSLDDVLFEATSYPFFGERKIIIVRRPRFLTTQAKYALDKKEQEALLDYLKQPADFSTIIFLAEFDRIDRRKKVVKSLQSAAQFLDLTQIKPQAMEDYFVQHVKQLGYEFTTPAWQLFTTLTNSQLSVMMHEFEKIRMFQKSNAQVEEDTVARLVSKTLEHSVFELNDHVLNRRPEVAIDIYRELLLQREEPIKIIALLMSEFRLLLQVKMLQKKRLGQQQITQILGVHPYRVSLALKKNQAFDRHLLSAALKSLITSDYLMKTGQVDPELEFEIFALKFAEQMKNPEDHLLETHAIGL